MWDKLYTNDDSEMHIVHLKEKKQVVMSEIIELNVELKAKQIRLQVILDELELIGE